MPAANPTAQVAAYFKRLKPAKVHPLLDTQDALLLLRHLERTGTGPDGTHHGRARSGIGKAGIASFYVKEWPAQPLTKPLEEV
jgi:hypothetical protein